MSQLPTGTVTFLFTDVEGSTRLLSEAADADAYRTLLEDHRRLIRDAVERHGGAIFGTEGDAVFAAFDRAVAALAAAADAERALLDHRWPANRQVRVRAGVHSGEVALTDGDYVGLTLHEVARISAAAHGGQILVSGTTRELATDAGLPALELRFAPIRARIGALCRLRFGSSPPHKGAYKGASEPHRTNVRPVLSVDRAENGLLVPHTGIAASLRWSPTEYGCNGGLRRAPMRSGRLEGTNEGTDNPTKRLHAGDVDDGTYPPAGLRGGLSITGLMANPVPDNPWRAAAVVLAVRGIPVMES